MKKLLSLLIALMMLCSSVGALAEGESGGGPSGGDAAGEDTASTTISLSDEEKSAEEIRVNTPLAFAVIPADETTGQEQLSYVEGTTAIIEVDGLKFKDMNKNGALDVYEDWRDRKSVV